MAINIERILAEKTKKVDSKIFSLVNTYASKELRKPIRYLFKSGGKRIRPAIGIITTEALCSKPEVALYPSVSCEIVHAASLIYDDILDNSARRRNRPTVHLKWEYPNAILAANQLLSLAIKAIAIDPKSNTTDFAKKLNLFSDAWITLCQGKLNDMVGDVRKVNEAQVLDIIYKKTAVLFELAAKSGAIYSNTSGSVVNSLANYGKNVGTAFQIQDDILGVIGDETVLGKDVGGDILEGKKTLMVSYVLNDGSANNRKKLLSALGNSNLAKSELDDVTEMLVSSGSVDYAKSVARKYSNHAIEQLDVLESTKHKKYLGQIAKYVVKRLK